eukprot:TRINITY_DN561_c3_g1_i1.p1 TRINITY_DN561_c3_g1~~TRINITY_DN561_c3_g1_i1.p1  ORF type:complete len:247 (+),score=63.09 TRINITY_DN561_c3_g1_i1:67-741(+)
MQQPYTVSQAIVVFERDEYERRCQKAIATGGPEPEVVRASEEEHVKLYAGGGGCLPAITKMDKDGLSILKACKRLALSSNAIDKIGPGLGLIPNLEILSLGRNKIKKLENLDLPNLKQLWLSYNFIDRLSGLDKLARLTTLYLSNNMIDKWGEIERLDANEQLSDLLLINNKVHTDIDKGTDESRAEYRLQVLVRLPQLTKIDGEPVEPEEREAAEARKTTGMM